MHVPCLGLRSSRAFGARLASTALALLLAVTLLGASAGAATSAQAAAPGLDTIQAVYGDLLDDFYRPLAPDDLLQAAWSSLSFAARSRGAADPGALPSLTGDRDQDFATFAVAYSSYLDSTSGQLDGQALVDEVGNAMATSVREEHTNYLTQSDYRTFLALVGGGQQAIGLGIRFGGPTPGLITEVAPGSPADQAGLRPGDVIVGVDGQALSGARANSLSRALSGDNGTSVQLSIDRGQGPQTVSVTRGAYYFPPLTSRLLPGNVGYLRLSEFALAGTSLPDGTELLSELDRQLDSLDARGATALVLDLRDNGGGSINTAEELLGRFLPEDVRPVHSYDQRGHDAYDLVSGLMRARQLPMALLVNGGSASASEIVASTLRDTHRAILVGQQTAGAVAASELFPLPNGGAMQIAVEGASAGVGGEQLDGVGVPVDVTVADTRTVDDYRAGRDPQLDAAVAALAQAPAPPAVQSTPTGQTAAMLEQTLGPQLPDVASVPTNDRLTQPVVWGHEDLTHPNEWVDNGGGGTDPVALRDAERARGYLGSVAQSYANTPGDQPAETVVIDLYGTADGAHQALASNDFPETQQVVAPLASLGDESVTYVGTWASQGAEAITWRRGREVISVQYSDVPGDQRPDTLLQLADLVDALAQQQPVP